MGLFSRNWQWVVAALGEGLDDARRLRLEHGLEYYRAHSNERLESNEITQAHQRWLNKSLMPLWTQVVHRRVLVNLTPEIIIDELIGFLELRAKNINGNFGYEEQLSSKSTDPECDQMEGFLLDFVEFCAGLHGA